MLTHANAVSFVDWCSEVFTPAETDRFSSHAPFHFDLSVLDIYVSLKHGASLYVISEDLGKSPKELAAFIASSKLTVWYSTPSILALLAQFGDLKSCDCSALRLVLFAGEVFPVKHLREVVSLWPSPGTTTCTDRRKPTSVHSPGFHTPIDPQRSTPYPSALRARTVKRLSSTARARSFRRTARVSCTSPGPLFSAAIGIDPNRTRSFSSIGIIRRWYNTGDVVRFEPTDGFIYLGRRDRMVKRRGYRIELGEIERGLYQHESVDEAAVVAVPDESSGVRIVAYLSTAAGKTRPSIIDLKMFCAGQLPSYMSADAFVLVDALPRTSTDKVDYQELKRCAVTGAKPQVAGA